ncbi:hypothetical protein DAEQUDRAFT_733696 [Daedalea quercina L-15889]|uniref:Uncharacterized protein n=1 Tax=Daedalea quercina L-15889 TaxID=1314783 RepID=A0A165KSX2_9APHY|nr:hypothetical protein DAEQUDRAFT_733696 [Daedalea quercina L-15889]
MCVPTRSRPYAHDTLGLGLGSGSGSVAISCISPRQSCKDHTKLRSVCPPTGDNAVELDGGAIRIARSQHSTRLQTRMKGR